MLFELSGHSFKYECENLCRVFFPYSPVRYAEGETPESGEPSASAVINRENGKYIYTARVNTFEESGGAPQETVLSRESGELSEYLMTSLLFEAFRRHTGRSPEWGMLTGIHPVKLLRETEETLGEEGARREFASRYFVGEKKLELAGRTLAAQRRTLGEVDENGFCLYVSIPFCPSRCSYCSFVSQSIEKEAALVGPYLEALFRELEKTAEVTALLGLKPVSAYIGGGTPTVLSSDQLSELIGRMRACFDFSECPEFTAEAGRPDTISPEKLSALKSGGVTRISINPQTLSDEVLEGIGRRHSAQDFYRAFEEARRAGFDLINADLIVGLEGDSPEGFKHSLNEVIALDAENITVHSLAIKRAARLAESPEATRLHRDQNAADGMMDFSVERLTESGYEPYYLYRQTRMAGNLENTGWSRPGKECLYNIFSMDESLSVIACGAGGVSKLKDPYSRRLERIFNFKYPFEYISRNDEIISRKDGVTRLYEQFRERIH